MNSIKSSQIWNISLRGRGEKRGFCSLSNTAELLARKIQISNASLLEIRTPRAASGASREMVTVGEASLPSVIRRVIEHGWRETLHTPVLARSEPYRALQITAAKKHDFHPPLTLKKFSGSLGEGQCSFFFVIMGPFVEMEEVTRSACLWCAGFPVTSRLTTQGPEERWAPAAWGEGRGLLQDGADGAAQCSGYSPALCVALAHRGLESDCSEERTQVLAAGPAQSSPVPGDGANPQV